MLFICSKLAARQRWPKPQWPHFTASSHTSRGAPSRRAGSTNPAMSHSRSVLAGGRVRTNRRVCSANVICLWLRSASLTASHPRSRSRRVSRSRSVAGSPARSAIRSATAAAVTRSRIYVDAPRREIAHYRLRQHGIPVAKAARWPA